MRPSGTGLAPEGRGRGSATRAVRLVSAFALAGLHLERVRLFTHPTNRASQAVALRCGYTPSAEPAPWPDEVPRVGYVRARSFETEQGGRPPSFRGMPCSDGHPAR